MKHGLCTDQHPYFLSVFARQPYLVAMVVAARTPSHSGVSSPRVFHMGAVTQPLAQSLSMRLPWVFHSRPWNPPGMPLTITTSKNKVSTSDLNGHMFQRGPARRATLVHGASLKHCHQLCTLSTTTAQSRNTHLLNRVAHAVQRSRSRLVHSGRSNLPSFPTRQTAS
jgi:hypothetical protein